MRQHRSRDDDRRVDDTRKRLLISKRRAVLCPIAVPCKALPTPETLSTMTREEEGIQHVGCARRGHTTAYEHYALGFSASYVAFGFREIRAHHSQLYSVQPPCLHRCQAHHLAWESTKGFKCCTLPSLQATGSQIGKHALRIASHIARSSAIMSILESTPDRDVDTTTRRRDLGVGGSPVLQLHHMSKSPKVRPVALAENPHGEPTWRTHMEKPTRKSTLSPWRFSMSNVTTAIVWRHPS